MAIELKICVLNILPLNHQKKVKYSNDVCHHIIKYEKQYSSQPHKWILKTESAEDIKTMKFTHKIVHTNPNRFI